MAVANTLAYYDAETIMAVKSFKVQAQFLSNFVRCKFLQQPYKLVRLSLKHAFSLIQYLQKWL
jgi:hypothetical protein